MTKLCTKCEVDKGIGEFYTSKENGVQGYCKECAKAYLREYRKTEKYIETTKRYLESEEGKEKRREYESREYVREKKELYHKSESGKVAYKKYRDSEKGKARNKRYKHSEKGRKKANELRYKRYWLDPEYFRMKAVISQLNKRGWGGEKTKADKKMVEGILHRDRMCVHCWTRDNLTFDHVTPTSKGGKTEYDNFQILCRSCNSSKGAR